MGDQEQSRAKQTWQEALDLELLGQLVRPLVQPGLVDHQLAGTILSRAEGMAGGLPLQADLAQRHGLAEQIQARQTPIVYARPRPEASAEPDRAAAWPEAPAPQPHMVQAKATPTQVTEVVTTPLSARPVVPSKAVQRSVDLDAGTDQTQQAVQRSFGPDAGAAHAQQRALTYAQQSPDEVGPADEFVRPGNGPVPPRPMVQARVVQRSVDPDLRAPQATEAPLMDHRSPAELNTRHEPPGGADLSGTELPIVQARAERPGDPHPPAPSPGFGRRGERRLEQAAEAGPAGEMPTVQASAAHPVELDDKPAVVVRPGKAGEHEGQPTSISPIRPVVVAPVHSSGKTGTIQRSVEWPVVVETRHPSWPGSPAPVVFHPSTLISNGVKPAHPGPTNRAAERTVVQRATSGTSLSPAAGAVQTVPAVVQRTTVEAGIDLDDLVERVQCEMDMEELAEKVQRKLRQRLVVESERRGWVQWP